VVVAVLGAVELVLFIWALVDLIRRPRTSLLPRWAWLVLMIVFELLGPIFYLALGRGEPSNAADLPVPGGESGRELDESRTQRAVEVLYGPGDATQSRPTGRERPDNPQSRPSQWAAPPDEPRRVADPPSGEDPAGGGPGGA
jgi:hypothetical protein